MISCRPRYGRPGLASGKPLAMKSLPFVYASWMQRFTSPQHRDELGDPPRSRLRLHRRLDSIEDRVSIRAAQRLEERTRLWVFVDRCLEVVRDLRGARGVVGAVPPTVGFGGRDGGESRGVHL